MAEATARSAKVLPLDSSLLIHEPAGARRDAPPLLFVHGAYVGAWCWAEYYLPYFSRLGFRACAVELRGPGANSAAATLADYRDRVIDAAHQLGRPPILIGHSMGGYLVQQCLSRIEVPAAVLMAPISSSGLLPQTLWLALNDPGVLQQMQVMQWFGPRAVEDWYGLDGARRPLFSPHLSDHKVAEFAARTRVESLPALLELCWPDRLDHPVIHGQDVLVIGAELDRLVSRSSVQATARQFETTAVFIEGIGHAMMLDAYWQRGAESIFNWLDARRW